MDHALIISNNRVISKRLDIILTLEGYACLPVYTSEEALNMLLKEKFNLVIIDEQVGKKAGEEILNHLLLNKFSYPIVNIRKKVENPDGWMPIKNALNVFDLELKRISQDLPEILKQMLAYQKSAAKDQEKETE